MIDSFEILTKRGTPMIRCPIPTKDDALPRILLAQILDKEARPRGIANPQGHHNQRATICIDRPVLRLTLPFVYHRNPDTLVAWPPDIATGITSNKMTFINIQHDDLLCDNLWCKWRQDSFDGFFSP